MPTDRLAKWQILLTEFDFVYVTRTAMKTQALADHMAENPIDDEYKPLKTYFPDEEINSVEEEIPDNDPRMARAYNKKVRPRNFEVGQLVVKRILPHQDEAKGKFAPNWQVPYVVKQVLSKGDLQLTDMEGKATDTIVNADSIKRYYI
ncbi:uncharacterized protein LOC107022131 [Solanum pennellii]|uniref:Uncharacterized protein LOC107022131 n=1 Tax=Solanum pennellii TaxID=28526 RepID=A0ABM1GZT7_SOLPN|nr:uncharacterized protein LOC107022131 [Solanum pennellii]